MDNKILSNIEYYNRTTSNRFTVLTAVVGTWQYRMRAARCPGGYNMSIKVENSNNIKNSTINT